jgi:hypothetical protein
MKNLFAKLHPMVLKRFYRTKGTKEKEVKEILNNK